MEKSIEFGIDYGPVVRQTMDRKNDERTQIPFKPVQNAVLIKSGPKVS
jgi:hypothetical protein